MGHFGRSAGNDGAEVPLPSKAQILLPTVALVVEDDGLQRMQASEMSTDTGYGVLEASDADEALLSRIRFHGKPHNKANVLRRARDMTQFAWCRAGLPSPLVLHLSSISN